MKWRRIVFLFYTEVETACEDDSVFGDLTTVVNGKLMRILVWSSKLNCLPHQLTSYFCHGFDTDPLCLFLCDVELQPWGFVDMKLYRNV